MRSRIPAQALLLQRTHPSDRRRPADKYIPIPDRCGEGNSDAGGGKGSAGSDHERPLQGNGHGQEGARYCLQPACGGCDRACEACAGRTPEQLNSKTSTAEGNPSAVLIATRVYKPGSVLTAIYLVPQSLTGSSRLLEAVGQTLMLLHGVAPDRVYSTPMFPWSGWALTPPFHYDR